MRGLTAIAIGVLTLLAMPACYEDPDYTGTSFRCGDVDGCPAHQVCNAGMCEEASPVGCGGATCASPKICCVDPSGVVSCAGTGAVCEFKASCTFDSGCALDQRCCWDGMTASCATRCATSVCNTNAECPAAAPRCCPSTQFPWKTCDVACH